MDTIRTYAVGNGEITLTSADAEELRRILQTEFLRGIITEILNEHKEEFSTLSRPQFRHLLDKMLRINSDYINYDSTYFEENIIENALRIAEDFSAK